MRKEHIIKAKERAKEVREYLKLEGPGVDLNEVITAINNSELANGKKIIVNETDLSKLKQRLGRSISGIIARDEDKVYIGIEKTEPPFRKRFTLAHELGHYFLEGHENEQIDFRDNIDSTTFGYFTHSKHEQEANAFAAELLMPEEQVVRYFEEISSDSRILARIFGVSYTAMHIRLKTLELLNGEE